MRADLPPARSPLPVGHFERQRLSQPTDWLLDRIKRLRSHWQARSSQRRQMLAEVVRLRGTWAGQDIAAAAIACGHQLRQSGLRAIPLAQAFALVDEALYRARGFYFHDTQLQAGWHLCLGQMAEMATGEGKTLTATLPSAVYAMLCVPVHVITVNDYLTERDREEADAVLAHLGITTGVVTHDHDETAKRHAYAQAVTYVTNKEVVFDYLRDRDEAMETLPLTQQLATLQRAKPPLVRDLGMAIVDEADSVLVDEANIPLILTAPTENGLTARMVEQAVELAARLDDSDWEAAEALSEGRIRQDRLRELIASIKNPDSGWSSLAMGEELLNQARVAERRYRRDVQYIIEDDALVIVDENTGRPMPDRSLPWGLQQVLEVREGLAPSKDRRTLSKLSYQRYFRRYHQLVGMSGTLDEVKGELRRVYECPIAPIPTHLPGQRSLGQRRLFRDEQGKIAAAVARVEQLRRTGRAVLVGVTSVALSEQVHAALTEHGIENGLINARTLADEADLISRAGESRRITVVTNMAGRGTDIKLSDECRQAGGLHVMILDCLESARLDRQLYGRAGRQGDPGSYDLFHSLDEKALGQLLPDWALRSIRTLGAQRSAVTAGYFGLLSWRRNRLERRKSKQRIQLMQSEDQRDDMLSFTRRT